MALGDVNVDGKLDLALVDHVDSAVVLFGNGDGTFEESVPGLTGMTPRQLALGDLNEDGWPDLVAVTINSERSSIFFGSGGGNFHVAVDLQTGGAYPWTVVIEDLNGDGHQDLAIPHDSSTVATVLLGDGRGNFLEPRDYEAGASPGRSNRPGCFIAGSRPAPRG